MAKPDEESSMVRIDSLLLKLQKLLPQMREDERCLTKRNNQCCGRMLSVFFMVDDYVM